MHTTTVPEVLSATTMIGDKVVSATEEELGKIEEVMIDLDTGYVAYAVLSFGGFMGMGNKLFAIPWEALALNPSKKAFLLDVDKEQLKNAPGFDKDNWPDFANREWGRDIHAYYGLSPYW